MVRKMNDKCYICNNDYTVSDRDVCEKMALFDDTTKPIKWSFFGKIIIKKGLFSKEEHDICWSCQRYMMENNIGDRDFNTHTFDKHTLLELDRNRKIIIEASLKENPPEKRTFEYWTEYKNKDINNELDRKKSIKNEILNLLKKHSTKMPASDIDAHLKHQNVDEIKKLCEEMYHGGKISRTANYRYFILSDEKKKPPKKTAAKKPKPRKTSAPKTDSVADEIKKFADLKDQGILTQEEFDAKKKELLG